MTRIRKQKINEPKRLFHMGLCLILTLTLAVSATGCTNKGNTGKMINSSAENNESGEFLEHKGMEVKKKRQLPETTAQQACQTDLIKLDQDDLESFRSFWDAHPTKYTYEKDYALEERLAEYDKLNLTYHHQDRLPELTADALYEIVKENNKAYLKNEIIRLYEEADETRVYKICKVIVKVVEQYLKEGHGLEEDRIKCTLSDLKILKNDCSVCYAYVTEDDAMVIAPRMIDNVHPLSRDFSEEEIYVHETMHLLQKECPCIYEENPNAIRIFGPFCQFDGEQTNPLHLGWILEALAEKDACDYLEMEPFTYTTMIYYYDSLTFTQLIRKDYQLQSSADLSFCRKLSELYDYFDVTNKQDQLEVLKMLYSVQIMQDCPEDFEKLYLKSRGLEKMTDEEVSRLRYLMKVQACQTYSRLFYKTLANALEEQDIPLCDVFYLIKLYEMDLNYHVLYNKEEQLEYNRELIQNYLDLQNAFFEVIARHLGVETEQLAAQFVEYAAEWMDDSGEKHPNYDLSWLPEEKKAFLQYMIEEHGEYAYVSVREVAR